MLLQKIKQEHLFDYVSDIVSSKEVEKQERDCNHKCFYMSKDNFDMQDNMQIFDDSGDLFLDISPPLINGYSQEDYLIHYNLFEDLEEKIQNIIDCDCIILRK